MIITSQRRTTVHFFILSLRFVNISTSAVLCYCDWPGLSLKHLLLFVHDGQFEGASCPIRKSLTSYELPLNSGFSPLRILTNSLSLLCGSMSPTSVPSKFIFLNQVDTYTLSSHLQFHETLNAFFPFFSYNWIFWNFLYAL